VWIFGNAWELVKPAGLAVAAGKAFTKGLQSWVLRLSIQKNGVLFVSRYIRHCEVGFSLETYCSRPHPVNLYGQWEFNLASKSCQSSIWRGCDEIWMEFIPLYWYFELIGQLTGESDLSGAGCLPTQMM